MSDVTGERKTAGWLGRAARDIAIFGAGGGMLIVVVKLTEYRFLVVDHSVEVYSTLVAFLFAGVGIWLGRSLAGKRQAARPEEVTIPGGFALNTERVRELGITPRELEILGLIAAGLTNREIAERLFVSENTVKTHSSRLFDKLGARRRTHAVRIAQAEQLLP